MPDSKKILHITPHLGGGVGRVILNYLAKVKDDRRVSHEVVCLDYANEYALETAPKIGLALADKMAGRTPELLEKIATADIVLIHWWNHPLLYDFLVRSELPACRTIMWSHISGFNPPYVFTKKALCYPDLFVFTTPISYETREVKALSHEQKKSLRVVWSTGGVEHVRDVQARPHSGFNVGYIGTVDYCKMHPDFLKLCARVNIPGVNFIVCGGPREKELAAEAERLGISDKINFTGLVPDIAEYLELFDVLGYPLAPHHYGTCDQVLSESMACGVVPVVLANQMETHIVKDGVNGIVAKNQREYVDAIERLYHDEKLRAELAANAREYALKTFSLDAIEQEWGDVFNEALAFPKAVRKWEINIPRPAISAKDVFLESLGEYSTPFELYCRAENATAKDKAAEEIKKLLDSPLWQSDTKGSVYHYDSFFHNDKYISAWNNLMRENKS